MQKKMRKGYCVAIVGAAAMTMGGLSSTASANTIDLSFDGLVFGNSSLTARSTLNSSNFYAGAMQWSEIGNPGNSFTTFCLEVTQLVSSTSTYTITSLAGELDPIPTLDSGGMGETRARLMQSLFDNHYGSALNSAFESAAFQLAVWEIVYEDTLDQSGDVMFDVTSGTHRITGGSVLNNNSMLGLSAVDQANIWLNGLSDTDVTTLQALTSGNSQNQVRMIPLPGPAGMAMAGLLGLAAVRRRRQG